MFASGFAIGCKRGRELI